MTTHQFRRAKDLFIELQSQAPAARRDNLARESDPVVRDQVEKLLKHDGDGDDLISRFSSHLSTLVRPPAAAAAPADMTGLIVGPYEIIRMLGQGGMGVVYLARDRQLGRMAALKAVSPEHAQCDPGCVQRLRREARVLASLSHPNLATVYGLEEAHDTLFIAIEYIDGPTLSQRLKRESMSIANVLSCGEQIAAALEEAHENGVIHRDLKPGNVMFTADGLVKVLDFGLARELNDRSDGTTRVVSESTRPITREGSLLGTPAYMSPEQTRGAPLDRRSDIFSFGSVLFRCLSGSLPFEGATDEKTIEAIRERDPDWSALPPNVSPGLRSVLERCLSKQPSDRYRHVGDLRLDLHDEAATRSWIRPAETPARSQAGRYLAAMAVAVLICLSVGAFVLSRPGAGVAPAVPATAHRFDIAFPLESSQRDLERIALALSPNGKDLVVACETAGTRALWARSHGDGLWRKIEKTEGAQRPVFSPDGEWVGFCRDSTFYKQRLSGRGEPIALTAVTNWYGASWADDGTLVYTPAWGTPLSVLDPHSAKSRPLETAAAAAGPTFINPFVVPGSRWVLHNVWAGGEECSIRAMQLDNGGDHLVIPNANTPRIASTPRGDYLLFERASIIFAVPFDTATATITGSEVAIAEGVMNDGTRFSAYFDVARDGTLVYCPGTSFSEESRLAYVMPDGTTTPLNADRRSFAEPVFSLDGNKLLVAVKGKVYRSSVYDLKQGTREMMLTGGDTLSHAPSPDGKTAAFTVNRDGGYGIDLFSLEDGRRLRRIVQPGPDYPSDLDWSDDGRFLTFTSSQREGEPRDVYVLDIDKGIKPRPLVTSPSAERQAVISPDSAWVAYCSEQSGVREIYLVSLPNGDRTRQVTSGGGESPAWAPDGKSLYFIRQGTICKVGITTDGAVNGQPVVVYDKPFGQSDPISRSYTVAPDGRLLIIEPSETSPRVSHLRAITNWYTLLP
jgi:eukaryotic-like serine/threonine-protein kinase